MKTKLAKDLECMIMTCGEATYQKCLDSVKRQTLQPKRIVTIENYYPINESINKRHEEMTHPFSVKVDADMVLYEECFDALYTALKNASDEHYAVTGMLLDPFIGSMGAVHMERSELVKHITVSDEIGCDRLIREEMKKRGYKILELQDIVGEHWCDWSPEAIFKRHVRVGQKHFYFRDKHHEDWIRNIGGRWINDDNASAFLALLGYCYGILTPDDREKGGDFMDEEWEAVEELIKDGVVPKIDRLCSLEKKP